MEGKITLLSPPTTNKIPPFFRVGNRVVLTKNIVYIEPGNNNCFDMTVNNMFFPMQVCENNSKDYELMKKTFFSSIE